MAAAAVWNARARAFPAPPVPATCGESLSVEGLPFRAPAAGRHPPRMKARLGINQSGHGKPGWAFGAAVWLPWPGLVCTIRQAVQWVAVIVGLTLLPDELNHSWSNVPPSAGQPEGPSAGQGRKHRTCWCHTPALCPLCQAMQLACRLAVMLHTPLGQAQLNVGTCVQAPQHMHESQAASCY